MNIYTGLLFQSGHIADPKLAMTLAAVDGDSAPPTAVGADHGQSGRSATPETRARVRRGPVFDASSVSPSALR